ncbi:hypothetical protein M9H77_28148 [Catharanthus roseus]|uniref:Uncharacterized protein n=1 Tax=Catharanthus roseus TaxID=4058 RepID=A0ACC0AG70_CATRO|nr:hypothetical protein M9H77_28148 [Catharanthus roseus]
MKNIFLPNLRELRLTDLIINEDAIEVLLPSCPSLEYMSITCCDFLSKSLTILASRLPKLTIFECELLEYNSLKLQAPMFSELTHVDNIVEVYEVMSMPCISLAHVSFWKFREGGVSIDVIVRVASRLLKELKNAPQLFLKEWFIEVIHSLIPHSSILTLHLSFSFKIIFFHIS